MSDPLISKEELDKELKGGECSYPYVFNGNKYMGSPCYATPLRSPGKWEIYILDHFRVRNPEYREMQKKLTDELRPWADKLGVDTTLHDLGVWRGETKIVAENGHNIILLQSVKLLSEFPASRIPYLKKAHEMGVPVLAACTIGANFTTYKSGWQWVPCTYINANHIPLLLNHKSERPNAFTFFMNGEWLEADKSQRGWGVLHGKGEPYSVLSELCPSPNKRELSDNEVAKSIAEIYTFLMGMTR